jgi:heme A synthase
MSIFEIGMLVCFGVSWPISIAKAVRTKVVAGKSPVFMALVSLGYLSGIVHKLLHNPDWVTALYALNMCMVLVDLTLYLRYSRRAGRETRVTHS